MAVLMKLKHVDELSGGRKRFRRRYPKVVAEVLGEDVFQVAMKAREGAALVTERERLIASTTRSWPRPGGRLRDRESCRPSTTGGKP